VQYALLKEDDLAMSLKELKAGVALGEDRRRQFKQDVNNADSLAAEMAAFANSERRHNSSLEWPTTALCRDWIKPTWPVSIN
jgi:uncharacterized membrane protein